MASPQPRVGVVTYPGPELPADVVGHTRSKYIEAFELLTKIPFGEYGKQPSVVLG